MFLKHFTIGSKSKLYVSKRCLYYFEALFVNDKINLQ